MTHLETLNSKLHDELTRKTLLLQELTSKGELYDQLYTRASKLEEEVSQLRQKDLVNSLTMRSLQEERETFASRNSALEQSQDLLRMDKMYLTKETERLSDAYRDAQRSIERFDAKNAELKRQKEELVDKLVKVREEHQTSYEEKLSVRNTTTTQHAQTHSIHKRAAASRSVDTTSLTHTLSCCVFLCVLSGGVESFAESYDVRFGIHPSDAA